MTNINGGIGGGGGGGVEDPDSSFTPMLAHLPPEPTTHLDTKVRRWRSDDNILVCFLTLCIYRGIIFLKIPFWEQASK